MLLLVSMVGIACEAVEAARVAAAAACIITAGPSKGLSYALMRTPRAACPVVHAVQAVKQSRAAAAAAAVCS